MEWEIRILGYLWVLWDGELSYARIYKPRSNVFEIEVWDYGGHLHGTVATVDNLEAAKALAQIMVQLRRSEYDAVQ